MRLVGQYTFETLRKAIQGVFGFYRKDNDYILELFSIRIVVTPNICVVLYIRNDQDYIKIGTFELH